MCVGEANLRNNPKKWMSMVSQHKNQKERQMSSE